MGRLLVNILGLLFAPLIHRIDSSEALSTRINSISSSMATQRGLLLMVGTGILALSLVVHGIVMVLMVSTDSFDRNLYLLCVPVTLFHIGVLAGFTGAMLATPLGQGYKDNK
jgi:hypothetical protein